MDVKLTVVSLFPDDAGAQDEATRLFGAELWRAGVDAVPVTGPAPEGAKSGAAQTIGQLAVAGVFSAATVTAISQIAVAFINRHAAKRIRLTAGDVELEIDGDLGPAQQEALAKVVATLADRGAAADR
ncbi:hypothetical protein [Dactylosporangium sp. NPDC050588]|uniref:hypothetical protein n=1 Tax=Dactylosporangium sp. NPDC050588 TaxID=3157211 RepID=UPI0033E70391